MSEKKFTLLDAVADFLIQLVSGYQRTRIQILSCVSSAKNRRKSNLSTQSYTAVMYYLCVSMVYRKSTNRKFH